VIFDHVGVEPWSFYICLGCDSCARNPPGATAPPLLIQEGSFNGSPPQMRRGDALAAGVVLSRKRRNSSLAPLRGTMLRFVHLGRATRYRVGRVGFQRWLVASVSSYRPRPLGGEGGSSRRFHQPWRDR